MDKIKDFHAQIREYILLGYTEDEKSYKLMELANRKCFIEHNVQFEEDQLLDTPESEAQGGINILPFLFEALHGNNPNVSHLRVFGSKYWTRIPIDKRKAFQD